VRPRNVLRATALAIVAGLSLVACGSGPYTYVVDSGDQAYFKVPTSWKQVNEGRLDEIEDAELQSQGIGGSYSWSRAYEEYRSPSAELVYASSPEPVVLASVLDMSATERNSLSFNNMRDLLLPVTAEARKAASAAHAELPGFHSIGNEVISDSGGIRGISEIFEYDVGTSTEVFDQTVLTNSATTKLYLLLVHCTLSCFASHKDQIAAVVQSFTVKGS
jgi:hypothetical protein